MLPAAPLLEDSHFGRLLKNKQKQTFSPVGLDLVPFLSLFVGLGEAACSSNESLMPNSLPSLPARALLTVSAFSSRLSLSFLSPASPPPQHRPLCLSPPPLACLPAAWRLRQEGEGRTYKNFLGEMSGGGGGSGDGLLPHWEWSSDECMPIVWKHSLELSLEEWEALPTMCMYGRKNTPTHLGTGQGRGLGAGWRLMAIAHNHQLYGRKGGGAGRREEPSLRRHGSMGSLQGSLNLHACTLPSRKVTPYLPWATSIQALFLGSVVASMASDRTRPFSKYTASVHLH